MIDKIKTLVVAKHFILKGAFDIIYDGNDKENNEFIQKWSKYFKIISELLDIEIDVKDFFEEGFNPNKIISFPINSSVYEDILAYDINEKFGSEVSILYSILTTITTLQYVTSFHTYGEIFENTSKERREIVNSEINYGNEYIQFYKDKFSSINFIHYKYFTNKTIKLFKKLNSVLQKDKLDYIKANNISSKIINELFPRFQEIDFHLNIAENLITDLEQCKQGIKEWNKYENICFDILQYLFIPEFDFIYTQKRTENGHQIRDAIIPNNMHFGFWKNIKDEFNSKNIVCEFKNGIKKNINKTALNQLRIYLSKKTIGRFGFLFVRKEPNKSLLQARKLAYEESNILILVVDDELFKKLILCRALFGKCDDLLKKEKIKFEVEY